MKAGVDIFTQASFKGEKSSYGVGSYEFHESFTQQELIGRTFYIIQSQSKDGKRYALDKSGDDNAGATFHLWEWSKDNWNQIFTMLSNGCIKNVKTGLVMDVSGGNFKDGVSIISYPQNNGENQLWTYDSSMKMLKLKNKPFALNLHNNELKNGGKINIWTLDGHESQKWDIQLCDIKDGFRARETFALRFYNPVAALNDGHEAFNRYFALSGYISLTERGAIRWS